VPAPGPLALAPTTGCPEQSRERAPRISSEALSSPNSDRGRDEGCRQRNGTTAEASSTGDFTAWQRNHKFCCLLPQNAASRCHKGNDNNHQQPLLQSRKNDPTATASAMAQALVSRAQLKAQTQEGLLGGTRHRRRMLMEGGNSPTSAGTAPLSGCKALPIRSSLSSPDLQFFMLLQYKQ